MTALQELMELHKAYADARATWCARSLEVGDDMAKPEWQAMQAAQTMLLSELPELMQRIDMDFATMWE